MTKYNRGVLGVLWFAWNHRFQNWWFTLLFMSDSGPMLQLCLQCCTLGTHLQGFQHIHTCAPAHSLFALLWQSLDAVYDLTSTWKIVVLLLFCSALAIISSYYPMFPLDVQPFSFLPFGIYSCDVCVLFLFCTAVAIIGCFDLSAHLFPVSIFLWFPTNTFLRCCGNHCFFISPLEYHWSYICFFLFSFMLSSE